MRIIDNKKDYYDYLACETDTLVFDRRKAFDLNKERMCSGLGWKFSNETDYRFLLLQAGFTYWLILVEVTEYDKSITGSGSVKNFNLRLLKTWKNYTRGNSLIDLNVIEIRSGYRYLYTRGFGYSKNKQTTFTVDDIKKDTDKLVDSVNRGEYEVVRTLSRYTKVMEKRGRCEREEITIPILRGSGLMSCVDALELFNAIEEHFSYIKTAGETTEAKGATNNDKIIMHGFDTVSSFRGK